MNEQEKIELHERLATLEERVDTLVKLVEKLDDFIDKWKLMGMVFMAIGGGIVFILDHWLNLTKALSRWLAGH